MAEQVREGEARVKFQMRWLGECQSETQQTHREKLAIALDRMWQLGCCPQLDDGFLSGNGAVLLPSGSLLVSMSGRLPQAIDANRLVEVVSFDSRNWSCEYRSVAESVKPTSDTPLYWAAMKEAPQAFGWKHVPNASLHGHLFATEAEANVLSLPMSCRETLFSTPEDREELMLLLRDYPYPEHSCVVRKGHGFFILQPDMDAAYATLQALKIRSI